MNIDMQNYVLVATNIQTKETRYFLVRSNKLPVTVNERKEVAAAHGINEDRNTIEFDFISKPEGYFLFKTDK